MRAGFIYTGVAVLAVLWFAAGVGMGSALYTQGADVIHFAGIQSDEPALVDTFSHYVPDEPTPPANTLADYITVASEHTGVPESWLWATGEIESNNTHRWPDGSVKRGDGGLAIGWGQVHRSPWEAWASETLGRDVDLYELADNVLVAAMILARYIDRHGTDIVTAAGHYNGGPYCNRRYGRAVTKAEPAYRGCRE